MLFQCGHMKFDVNRAKCGKNMPCLIPLSLSPSFQYGLGENQCNPTPHNARSFIHFHVCYAWIIPFQLELYSDIWIIAVASTGKRKIGNSNHKGTDGKNEWLSDKDKMCLVEDLMFLVLICSSKNSQWLGFFTCLLCVHVDGSLIIKFIVIRSKCFCVYFIECCPLLCRIFLWL